MTDEQEDAIAEVLIFLDMFADGAPDRSPASTKAMYLADYLRRSFNVD